MPRAPHDCPGSWLPVPDLKPGDVVICDFCGLNVAVVAAPLDWAHDPWRGSKEPRVEPHRPPKRAPSASGATSGGP